MNYIVYITLYYSRKIFFSFSVCAYFVQVIFAYKWGALSRLCIPLLSGFRYSYLWFHDKRLSFPYSFLQKNMYILTSAFKISWGEYILTSYILIFPQHASTFPCSCLLSAKNHAVMIVNYLVCPFNYFTEVEF